MTAPSLGNDLDRHTVPGALCRQEGAHLRCVACGHRCLLPVGRRGICKVRRNEGGQLLVPFGYVAGVQCDPVEKKPFFHVDPSADVLTFGMLGCDFHCGYCQNWVTSQALRDTAANARLHEATPEALVKAAVDQGARWLVSSYNEPLITAEWSRAVFESARAHNLRCAFVSNGNATPEALDYIGPFLSAYKVDLKSFNDRNYRSLGGVLNHVLEGIGMIHRRGIWLEVVTLLVPGFNDTEAELREIAAFLRALSPDIPWHVTAFHPDYKMTGPPATKPEQLIRAAEIGREAGLRFVYAGNAPGQVASWEHTRCPFCQTTLIERLGYRVLSYQLTSQGHCSKCNARIPGLWPAEVSMVRLGVSLRNPRRVNL